MKYKVVIHYSDGTEEEEDKLYDSKEQAEEAGSYGCSCYRMGREILNLSNPGDYPLNEDDDCDFEVIEVDD
ncbi:hypothetical protein [Bifidobacterium pseudocatenulatum]|uniref:hypothetical protein n=1 Tax=Bifidobacterium pseudocatenulatum TaxID=28026 RepID=UPI000E4A0420|nr:hypothetical protein [Bifidobacterium pseudocatenulatum]RHH13301.1 hypothetical protein DW224_03795 [Bifidobacterium pseudocatenulatum]